ncbi:hypothetical protein BJ170DRAFT_397630 [Xylariales sp. AK1849]|nr:hypothetical protein BJ170DRAFT_397630 [Xylariales sp. AK1849]
MSGFEVAGIVLGAFPIVLSAISAYKAMKPGRAAAPLSRKLRTEHTIYDQFLRDLLRSAISTEEVTRLMRQEPLDITPWKEDSLRQNIQTRLGDQKTGLVIEHLEEMSDLMQTLKAEVANLNRGTEVLGKFKERFARARAGAASMPQSSIQLRLSRLSEMNKDLRRLLNEQPLLSSYKLKESSSVEQMTLFFHKDFREPLDLYEAMKEGYTCDCPEAHLTNFGCNCSFCKSPFGKSESSTHKWEFELVFPSKQHASSDVTILRPENDAASAVVVQSPVEIDGTTDSGNSSVAYRRKSSPIYASDGARKPGRTRSISISADHPKDRETGNSVIRNLCSVVEDAVENNNPPKRKCLGVVGTDKRYMLCVTKPDDEVSGDIICLADLIQPGNHSLTRKKRMQLAFRLCSAVLQLCTTPWIDESWSWKDLYVLKMTEEDEVEDRLSNIFVTREFYSVRVSVNKSKPPVLDTFWAICTDEPKLTKLGFALIELAFGRSLREINEDKPSLFSHIHENLGQNSLNLHIAKTLLKTGRIAEEAGHDYERVVQACIYHQYRERGDLGIRGLKSADASFLHSVEEAIMAPLFDVCKLFG